MDPIALLNQLIEWIAANRTLLLFLVCAGLGGGGAWLIAGIPFREELLDRPKERSSHDVPTPRGGGVGILMAFLVAGMTLRLPATFIVAVILVSAVSLYGDYFRLSIKFRLAVQFLAAVVFLTPVAPRLGILGDFTSLSAYPMLLPLILLLVLLFIVGTANFYNFMDGINGIAGVSGVIAFGLLGGYTLAVPPSFPGTAGFSTLSICVALACLGFLPFNMPRARVFVGDVGSILLGFAFAALVIVLAGNYRELICFASLLFPFYIDELTTMYVRLRAGENLLEPHRRHLYQLLANEGGMEHWKVTALYGVLQLGMGIGILAARAAGMVFVYLVLLAGCAVFITATYRVRVKLEGSASTT